jgi:hypothetical protein
MGWGQTAEM